ncbi:hypothetical protein VTN31DRAFT_4718 [Thermomyces dupontii]|uniref:uncharacterized protein n=1 Tax=Talaromyces thermophilus TaxID=28565 RepID=UPI003743B3D2
MERLSIYILTFNCARNVVPREHFATNFFHALGPSESFIPHVLVVSLQEIAPIAYAFLGGSLLHPYFHAVHAAVELAVRKRWGNGVKYTNLVTEYCGMTGILVFVRTDVAHRVALVSTAATGLGVHDMGNKAAVAARLAYRVPDTDEDVELTFVAAHIAPMEHDFKRRNEDWRKIVERLVFVRDVQTEGEEQHGGAAEGEEEATALLQQPQQRIESGMFTPRTHLFFAGDLNYRTSDRSPTRDDVARFPQPVDDVAHSRHHSQLFRHDQLTRERRAGRTLHGLVEAPVAFPPTYKYSEAAQAAATRLGGVEEPTAWYWASNRWPSWCDRILYLDMPPWMKGDGEMIEIHGYDALPLFPTSDHRAVGLAVSVPLQPIHEAPSSPATTALDRYNDVRWSPPFPIDPNWRSKRAVARNKEIAVGVSAYLALTWKGNGLVLATGLGIFATWTVLRWLLGGGAVMGAV